MINFALVWQFTSFQLLEFDLTYLNSTFDFSSLTPPPPNMTLCLNTDVNSGGKTELFDVKVVHLTTNAITKLASNRSSRFPVYSVGTFRAAYQCKHCSIKIFNWVSWHTYSSWICSAS